jgi:cell division septation protein DedD
VLAAVIFIPMILAGSPPGDSGDARPTRAADGLAQTPDGQSAADDSRFSSRIVPLGESPSGRDAAGAIALDKARERISEAIAVSSGAAPAASPVPSPPVDKSTKPNAATNKAVTNKAVTKRPPVRKAVATSGKQTASGRWVVQLGSFATARNAHALRDRLKSKGYKAFARSSGSGVDAVTRVYVGPDATRDAARQRVGRLLDETRLKGFVVRNPGP